MSLTAKREDIATTAIRRCTRQLPINYSSTMATGLFAMSQPNRAFARIPDPRVELFSGVIQGIVATRRRGEGGFGYDPHFRDDGTGLTGAELPLERKNALSQAVLTVVLCVASLITTVVAAKVDELFMQGQKAFKPEDRAKAYREVQKILTDEVPAIWLVEYGIVGVWSKKLHGLHTWSAYSYYQFWDTWPDSGKAQ